MGNVDLLLDAPAIPRVLRLLMEKSGEEQASSVMEALPDRALHECGHRRARGRRGSSAGRTAFSR